MMPAYSRGSQVAPERRVEGAPEARGRSPLRTLSSDLDCPDWERARSNRPNRAVRCPVSVTPTAAGT